MEWESDSRKGGGNKRESSNGTSKTETQIKEDMVVEESGDCAGGVCKPLSKGERMSNPPPELQQPSPQALGWKSPPKELFRPFLEAVHEFGMFRDGDRVLVCLSGGKDSLSLLHILRQYQFSARKDGVRLELGAVTVDPGSSAYDPRPLVPYLDSLGVKYLYEEQVEKKYLKF